MSLDFNKYRLEKTFETIKDENNSLETYFDIDKDKKEATLNLLYDKPEDIFDNHIDANLPILSDAFLDELYYGLRVVPTKYNVNYNISFKTFNGYSEDELDNIFIKSMMITNEEWNTEGRKTSRLAGFFLTLGIIFLIIMWTVTAIIEHNISSADDKLWFRILSYVLDILVTVVIWEAATLFFVQRQEAKVRQFSINKRINIVTFKEKTNQ